MADWLPRVKVFGGKAASSYAMAKLIIKLGNDIARVINQDPAVRDLLKVVFLPNYNVTLAEKIRSEEHTSELQSLMRISYAVFCLKKKKNNNDIQNYKI